MYGTTYIKVSLYPHFFNHRLSFLYQIESLHRVGVGHLAKLHLEWERPWWARGEGGLSLAWDPTEMKTRRLPRDWVRWVGGFSEVEGQPGLLVCWVAGDGARVVDQLDDEEVNKEKNYSSNLQ